MRSAALLILIHEPRPIKLRYYYKYRRIWLATEAGGYKETIKLLFIRPDGFIRTASDTTGGTDLVPEAGIEPARSFLRGILSPLRLPISPPGLSVGNQKMEAGVGIEPAYTELQSAA